MSGFVRCQWCGELSSIVGPLSENGMCSDCAYGEESARIEADYRTHQDRDYNDYIAAQYAADIEREAAHSASGGGDEG